MAGVMSLMQPQGQQGPMPGQAPMQQMPGMMPQQGAATPAAMVGPLTQMHTQQLVQLMLNPRPEGPPLYAVISAIAEKQKAAKAAQAAQGQQVMAQNQQMQQQPPVAAQVVQAAQEAEEPVMAAYGGEMQGYADGGAVAFTNGAGPDGVPQTNTEEDISDDPSLSFAERRIRAEKRAALARQQGIGRPFAERYPGAAAEVSQTDTGDETARLAARAPASRSMVSPEVAALMQRRQGPRGITSLTTGLAPPRRTPQQNLTSARPNSGIGGLMSPTEITGTPAPDALSSIESEGVAGIRALQNMLRQQGTVDPELQRLREAAYKSSQDIAARRERDRQAALEAAQKQYANPTDLLLAMAGSAAGGKTALDVLSGAARGAGTARAAKRAELQRAQAVSSQEQKAIEDLNQALAEKRVADRSGDVNLQRQADIKVAEAQLKITDLRSGIQKERATQLDRAEQRDIQRGQLAVQQQQARLAAAQAGREPEKIRMMRTLGIPITEAGFKTFVEIEATGRLEGAAGRNNVAALRELGEWDKGPGANIKAMNAKNPQVYEDARRAKIREINAALGANIPLGGGAGQVDTNNPLLKQ